mmetsp:Transcript_2576/g.6391  ORF Transcript_2576/g.6391 Transcript_2576/m.6391 type:complete len:228 (-) Transcript_2576:190-873(-)
MPRRRWGATSTASAAALRSPSRRPQWPTSMSSTPTSAAGPRCRPRAHPHRRGASTRWWHPAASCTSLADAAPRAAWLTSTSLTSPPACGGSCPPDPWRAAGAPPLPPPPTEASSWSWLALLGERQTTPTRLTSALRPGLPSRRRACARALCALSAHCPTAQSSSLAARWTRAGRGTKAPGALPTTSFYSTRLATLRASPPLARGQSRWHVAGPTWTCPRRGWFSLVV